MIYEDDVEDLLQELAELATVFQLKNCYGTITKRYEITIIPNLLAALPKC